MFYVIKFFLIALALYSPAPWARVVSGSSSDDVIIKFSFDHFSYAGPMPVFQLANDWHGDIKSDDDAISFIQAEMSATFNRFTVSALNRTYHSFLIGNDLARGFYYYNNNITLDEELRIDATLDARTYSGKGIRLGYEFTSSDYFGNLFSPDIDITFAPSLVALRLDDIIWGGLKGELFYTDTKNWGGTVDVDYSYTEDHIARRPLTGDYIGQLYALDINSSISTPWLDAGYQGINIYGRIYWDGLPTTTAQVSTETAFLLLGHEYYDDVILDPPPLHFINANIPLGAVISDNLYWKTDARLTPIKSFYYHGLEWRQMLNWFGEVETIKASIQYDLTNKTPKLSLALPGFSLVFASQTWDVSKSQSLIAKLAFSLTF